MREGRDLRVTITLDNAIVVARDGERAKDARRRVTQNIQRAADHDGDLAEAVQLVSTALDFAGVKHDGLALKVERPRRVRLT